MAEQNPSTRPAADEGKVLIALFDRNATSAPLVRWLFEDHFKGNPNLTTDLSQAGRFHPHEAESIVDVFRDNLRAVAIPVEQLADLRVRRSVSLANLANRQWFSTAEWLRVAVRDFEAEHPMPEGGKYLLASYKRPSLDKCVTWWGPDHAGYSTDLVQAGHYSRAECDSILTGGVQDFTVAVPLHLLESAEIRVQHTMDTGDSANWSMRSPIAAHAVAGLKMQLRRATAAEARRGLRSDTPLLLSALPRDPEEGFLIAKMGDDGHWRFRIHGGGDTPDIGRATVFDLVQGVEGPEMALPTAFVRDMALGQSGAMPNRIYQLKPEVLRAAVHAFNDRARQERSDSLKQFHAIADHQGWSDATLAAKFKDFIADHGLMPQLAAAALKWAETENQTFDSDQADMPRG